MEIGLEKEKEIIILLFRKGKGNNNSVTYGEEQTGGQHQKPMDKSLSDKEWNGYLLLNGGRDLKNYLLINVQASIKENEEKKIIV